VSIECISGCAHAVPGASWHFLRAFPLWAFVGFVVLAYRRRRKPFESIPQWIRLDLAGTISEHSLYGHSWNICELQVIVELNRGDLLYFMDHLINHSNEKAYGVRHSVVAFTENQVWTWLQRVYGFVDARVNPLRMAEKRYRKN